MFYAIRKSLSFLTTVEKLKYFTLVGLKAFSGFLDVIGIALTGLLAGIAASSFDSSKPLVVLGIALPEFSENMILVLVLVVLGVFAGKAVIAVGLGYSISRFLAEVDSEKSTDIANYLFNGENNRMNALSKGEITWAVMGSTANAFAGLLTNLSIFVSEGLLLVLVAGTFLFVDPFAALFVFVYFALVIFSIQLLVSRLVTRAGVDAAEGNMNSIVAIDDLINAYKEITVFGKQSFFIDKFEKSRIRLAHSGGTLNFLSGMPRYVVETALMLGVVIFVGYQFVTGQLATGFVTVGVFLTGGVRLMASMLPLQNAAANAKNQVEQAEIAHQLLTEARTSSQKHNRRDIARQSEEPSNSHLESAGSALGVRLENVTFRYQSADEDTLRNLSLEIQPGTHVAFIGPSGAGKTTLVDIILGLLKPSKGQVHIWFGEETNTDRLSKNFPIAYVPQNPGMVTGTLAENVALGVPIDQIDEDRVKSALGLAHLTELIESRPEGIYTSLGSQSDGLSGGQIQRLGLARALYEQPRLLVLDEATSALDASSEALISQSLAELGDSVTVIVIAHRLSTVQHSDCVFVVEDGKISASGSFKELRKTAPMVAEYVKLMSFEDVDGVN